VKHLHDIRVDEIGDDLNPRFVVCRRTCEQNGRRARTTRGVRLTRRAGKPTTARISALVIRCSSALGLIAVRTHKV
jgi:hypothetical protein